MAENPFAKKQPDEMKEGHMMPKKMAKKKRHMGMTAADGATALAKRLGY